MRDAQHLLELRFSGFKELVYLILALIVFDLALVFEAVQVLFSDEVVDLRFIRLLAGVVVGKASLVP